MSDTSVLAGGYLGGTLIRTARGDLAIEELARGDRVETATGGTRPVIRLGRWTLDAAHHPDPRAVWPVRVSAGAFDEVRPARDLWVSPSHAVRIGDVLTPIRALLNGRTVVQHRRPQVDYWHVELDSHDVILAEGLAAESHLDSGDRCAFAGDGDTRDIHPDVGPRHGAVSCLPLVEGGPDVIGARARLLARATALGHRTTADPDLHALVDGRRVEPMRLGERRYGFLLPEAAARVALRSRSFVPAHVLAGPTDTRLLGICVGHLQIDGETVALDAPALREGWHGLERRPGQADRRWTRESVPLPAGTRLVVVDLAVAGLYWDEPAGNVVTAFR